MSNTLKKFVYPIPLFIIIGLEFNSIYFCTTIQTKAVIVTKKTYYPNNKIIINDVNGNKYVMNKSMWCNDRYSYNYLFYIDEGSPIFIKTYVYPNIIKIEEIDINNPPKNILDNVTTAKYIELENSYNILKSQKI